MANKENADAELKQGHQFFLGKTRKQEGKCHFETSDQHKRVKFSKSCLSETQGSVGVPQQLASAVRLSNAVSMCVVLPSHAVPLHNGGVQVRCHCRQRKRVWFTPHAAGS